MVMSIWVDGLVDKQWTMDKLNIAWYHMPILIFLNFLIVNKHWKKYHGAIQAGVRPGSIVYVAGAGPVGLASAASCHLLGAACVIVGDMIPERLAQARTFGCETIDLRQEGSLRERIAHILGPNSEGQVDGAVDCVGFEARGNGLESAGEVPAQVLNDCMSIVREGGRIGIPGLVWWYR
jgi:glutathione-independent formaldehyde dehydrogenase